ncbi:Uncharacterised protein [Mycobacteroides abscessus subsp. massiliense]|nr:Uncharacterised protein [Mycobacteroides abscessus subsp. massiliense]SKU96580.1 Uncharacterised protein [Mycobacteroides abscessus subsp. massiliense]
MLYTPDGGRRVAYSRCSTLAKDLDKPGDGLFAWHQANAMFGLAQNPQLLNRVKAIIAKGGSWDSSKGEIKEVINQAETIGGAMNKSSRGTSIHDFTGVLEEGNLDWSLVDEDMKPILDGYHECIASIPGMTFLAREVFLQANDRMELPDGRVTTLRAAGSADRIVEWNGVRYMVDIKTGKDDQYRMGVCAQLALYVMGQLYQDSVVQQDIPWADFWPNGDSTAEFADHDCDTETALMFHCPQTPDKRGKWRWGIYEVPLARGRDIVRGGQWARKLRVVPELKRVA